MNASVYTQDEMILQNGRHAWLYLINSPIGNIWVIDYEEPTMEIKRRIIDGDIDKAQNYFRNICKKMIDGKI